jgi:hypothetical protein
MIREGVLFAFTAAGALALVGWGSGPIAFGDDFDHGVGGVWALRQQQSGTVDTVRAPGRPGLVLRARAAAKGAGVTKAALVARPGAMRNGQTVRVGFDLMIPAGTPANSLQLVDLEFATCAEGGNPGIRLYLRRGRLRIDRSKIGIAKAWLDDAAPQLAGDRWYRVGLVVRLGAADGAAQVTLDGRTVLTGRGDTLLPGADHIDRVQIGITANSNPVPATLYLDDVAVSAR